MIIVSVNSDTWKAGTINSANRNVTDANFGFCGCRIKEPAAIVHH